MRIPEHRPDLGEEEIDAIESVFSDGWISKKGPEVDNFEQELAAYLDAEDVLATDSCTASLHLALESYGIGPGDEVLVQDFTYGATATAVLAVGAEPVIVDVDPETYGMDPETAREAMNEDTAAMIVSHMLGRPAKLDELYEISEENGIPLIEDAAQAFGSEFRGDSVGTVGDVGCFSFSWNKPLTTAKGGAVTARDQDILERMRETADYGRSVGSRDSFSYPGYNYRMDSIRASIGRVQLERFDEIIREKLGVFEAYANRLEELPLDAKVLQDSRDTTVMPYIYMVQVDEKEEFQANLQDQDIEVHSGYRPLHTMPAFDVDSSYPVTTSLSDSMVGLPSHRSISEKEIEKVCDAIEAFYR